MPVRVPLSRTRVLRTATALADAEGLDGLTMRALAARLDVVPMALYKHVSDKDDLLTGMVDLLIDDFPAPAPAVASAWQSSVRDSLLGARAIVSAHPWARRAMESRVMRTPAVLGHMERLSTVLLAGGFTPDQTHHVMHLLGNRIWGFSPELFPGEPAAVDPANYPAIMAIATDTQNRRPGARGCDEEFEFGFALDVLLEGIERLKNARWASSG